MISFTGLITENATANNIECANITEDMGISRFDDFDQVDYGIAIPVEVGTVFRMK